MKLSEKGHYAPPPQLKPAAQRVANTLSGWEGMQARTHWLLGDENEIDGADFYCGDQEVGHIHLDSEAHIFLPRTVADALINSGLARRMPWSRDAVMFGVNTLRDVDHAIRLFRLSYDRRRGASHSELLARVRESAGGEAVV